MVPEILSFLAFLVCTAWRNGGNCGCVKSCAALNGSENSSLAPVCSSGKSQKYPRNPMTLLVLSVLISQQTFCHCANTTCFQMLSGLQVSERRLCSTTSWTTRLRALQLPILLMGNSNVNTFLQKSWQKRKHAESLLKCLAQGMNLDKPCMIKGQCGNKF